MLSFRKLDWLTVGPVAVALLGALFLGGSSAVPPFRTLLAEAIVFLAFAIVVLRRGLSVPGWAARMLVLLPMLVAFVQLMPVPPAIWRIASGGGAVAQGLELAGVSGWRPLTLDVEATVRSVLFMFTCVATFLSVLVLDRRERLGLVAAFILTALCSLLLAAAQKLTGSSSFYLFDGAVRGTFTGLFGNRNHHGDFLVMATAATVGMSLLTPDTRMRAILYGIAGLFAAAAIATMSRSAILLLVFAVAAILLMNLRVHRRAALLVGGGGLVALMLLFLSPVAQTALSRFGTEGGPLNRLVIWRESMVAVSEFLPMGGGLGTFPELYASIEQLDLVSPYFVNQAHNDLLQLLVEGGVIGGLVALALVVIVIWQIWLALRSGPDGALARLAAVCLAIPLLHSLVDYPLRTIALGVAAAMFAGMLFPSRDRATEDSPSPVVNWPLRAMPALIAAVLLCLTLQTGMAGLLLQRGDAERALQIMPYSSEAMTQIAVAQLGTDGDPQIAIAQAGYAVQLDPLDSTAWAMLSVARRGIDGEGGASDAALLQGAALGWRNRLVQALVFDRAVATGSADLAAQSADALLRQGVRSDLVISQIDALMVDEGFRNALAERLAVGPRWSNDFIGQLKTDDPRLAAAHLDLLTRLASKRGDTSGAILLPYARRTIAEGHASLLLQAWRTLHPDMGDDPSRGIVDGGFERLGKTEQPFGWLMHRDSAIAMEIRPADGGQELHVESYATDPTLVVSQLTLLPTGRYEIDYSTQGNARFQVRVNCIGGGARPVRGGVTDAQASGRVLFNVPVTRCQGQQIQFLLLPSPDTPVTGSLDRVAILPAS
ncbi:hypothetical protein GRI97_08895 [Altererythrobacter xixiisoli]|uniref:O-antigen ligase-related domain-containing protein n=1 Tax=Croceibacterium xixiisoli TaxID=1476466 RepID=A0A6I4TT83_9SPHN|nr:O-antigen ligase family protein [Croceibacterium xixiisoli]MXO99104.1 hypothetical protein [Croceibacterium xixiisoli]